MRNILKLGAMVFSMLLMFSPQKAEGTTAVDCSLYRYCVNGCGGCIDLCNGFPWYGMCAIWCEPGGYYCPGETVCRCAPYE